MILKRREPRIRNPSRLKSGISVIFISSIFSLVGLYLTIDNQISDRFYKEAAVKPDLIFVSDMRSGKMSLRNRGTGPAIISSFVVSVNGTSILAPYENDDSIKEGFFDLNDKPDLLTSPFLLYLTTNFLADYGLSKVMADIDYAKFIRVLKNIPSLNAGVEETYFDFDVDYLYDFVQEAHSKGKLSKEDSDRAYDISTNFMRRFIYNIEINICYCSITNLYCSGISYPRRKTVDCQRKVPPQHLLDFWP